MGVCAHSASGSYKERILATASAHVDGLVLAGNTRSVPEEADIVDDCPAV